MEYTVKMIPSGPGAPATGGLLRTVQEQSGVLNVRLIGDSLQPMGLAPGVFPGAIKATNLRRRFVRAR